MGWSYWWGMLVMLPTLTEKASSRLLRNYMYPLHMIWSKCTSGNNQNKDQPWSKSARKPLWSNKLSNLNSTIISTVTKWDKLCKDDATWAAENVVERQGWSQGCLQFLWDLKMLSLQRHIIYIYIYIYSKTCFSGYLPWEATCFEQPYS